MMHPRSRPPVGKTGVIACGKKIKSLTLGIIEIPTGKTMKRLIGNIRLTVLVIVLLSAFNMGATAKDKMVERGMDKKEVRAILGKPRGTSFDQYGETWTYAKGALIGDFYKMITVHFDLSGKVVTYQEQFYDMSKRDSAPIGSTMQQRRRAGRGVHPEHLRQRRHGPAHDFGQCAAFQHLCGADLDAGIARAARRA